MFKNLSSKLINSLHKIHGRGRLTEDNIKNTLREVRVALLEADVTLPVISNFINRVKNCALKKEINTSLTPSQEFIKIVHNELIHIISGKNHDINVITKKPAIILLLGLQGVGKTSSACKLGKYLYKYKNKKVLITSIDIYKPAGIKHLQILSKNSGIDFFSAENDCNLHNIVNKAINKAKLKFYDLLIIDTPGCLYNNNKVMYEINNIFSSIELTETFFIVDSMSGQNIINSIKFFNKTFPCTGTILTKMDSDARGGVALSICYWTNKPIKFISCGENIDALKPFNPEYLAKRILGMHDTLSLIQEITNKIDLKTKKEINNKLRKSKNFNFIDLLDYLKYIKNLGNISNLMKKFFNKHNINKNMQSQFDLKFISNAEVIINSMTNEEKINPDIIKGSRKKRIALGSGKNIQEINQFLKKFTEIKLIFSRVQKGKLSKLANNIRYLLQ